MCNKQILFIARTLPYPVRGGDLIVLDNITEVLTESGYVLDLLCFGKSKQEKQSTRYKNIYLAEKDSKINIKKIFEFFFSGKSYLFNRFYSKKLSQKLLKLVKTGEYSAIVFEHTYMYVNVLFSSILQKEIKKRNIKIIINTHVLESSVFRKRFDLETNNSLFYRLRSSFIKKESKLLKKIESDCIKEADKAVFLGQSDLDTAEKILPESKEKFYLPEPLSSVKKYTYSESETEEKNTLYFAGTYSWVQNSDAVMYFAKEVFPLVLKKNLEAKFYIIGMNAGRDIKNLHDGKNIFFIGEKEDILEEIKKYSLLVNPLRIKGGTSLKIREALACGKAVITTSAGMAGIDDYGENPAVIADSSEKFAEKVLEVLSDDALRKKIKENARSFAENRFSHEKFKEAVLSIFLRF